MYLFYVQEPVTLLKEPVRGVRRGLRYRPVLGADTAARPHGRRTDAIRLTPPSNGVLTRDELFFGFSLPLLKELATFSQAVSRPSIIRLLSRRDQARTMSLPRMPIGLGARKPGALSLDAQLDAARLRAHARIAILNPFGYALGDTLVLLSALREFRGRLEQSLGAVRIDVLQHPDNVDTEHLYLQSGVVRGVYHLPAPLSLLARYDAYVDFTSDVVTRGLCWTDDILEMFGIDHRSVPDSQKRNVLTVESSAIGSLASLLRRLRSSGTRTVLFHGLASDPMRSMPESVMRRVLDTLLQQTDWTLVALHPLPVQHPRIRDWSRLSTNFHRYAYIISQMDAFLCVDTSVYHVADAFDVPGVALFTTVRPHLRTLLYPRVHSILIGGDANALVTGQAPIVSAETYLEPFWAELDVKALVGLFEKIVTEGAAATAGRDRAIASR
jgi:glycosyl transferase family 9 (putative heptosyltransferase)